MDCRMTNDSMFTACNTCRRASHSRASMARRPGSCGLPAGRTQLPVWTAGSGSGPGSPCAGYPGRMLRTGRRPAPEKHMLSLADGDGPLAPKRVSSPQGYFIMKTALPMATATGPTQDHRLHNMHTIPGILCKCRLPHYQLLLLVAIFQLEKHPKSYAVQIKISLASSSASRISTSSTMHLHSPVEDGTLQNAGAALTVLNCHRERSSRTQRDTSLTAM